MRFCRIEFDSPACFFFLAFLPSIGLMDYFLRVLFWVFEGLRFLKILRFGPLKPSNSTFCFLESLPKEAKVKQYWLKGRSLRFYLLSWQDKKLFFEKYPLPKQPWISQRIDDKWFAKRLFRELDLKLPRAYLVYSFLQAKNCAQKLGFPLIVKPRQGSLTQGVSLVRRQEELRSAYRLARSFSRSVILEEFIKGKHFRVLILGNKVFVVQRIPFFVQGDGKSTIGELVQKENKKRRELYSHLPEPHFVPKKREEIKEVLSRRRLSENSILPKGKKLIFDWRIALAYGGVVEELTTQLTSKAKREFGSLARKLGLRLVGFDVIAKSFRNLSLRNAYFIEANTYPYLSLHQYPFRGEAQPVGRFLWKIISKEWLSA